MVAIDMMQRKDGKNRTVWCGEVVEGLTFSHEIKNKDTEEVIEKFYRFSVKTQVKTNKGKLLDVSTLPIIVSGKQLEELEKEVEIGDVVFIRGSWRAYTVVDENNRRKVEQVGFVHHIVHSELKDGKYLNRFDFEGYLVSKLYEPERDEEGNPVRAEDGTFKPLLDEEGNKKYTVRLNKEKKVVNDFTIAINTENRSFYIPSLSYFNLAKKVAEEIPVGSKVKGSGYIRSRQFEKSGQEHTVYEAVVVALDVVEEKEENTEATE